MSFSRTQLGTHPEYFEGFSRVLGRSLNLRKSLSDAGFELVPGGGIEPSTHGFSVSTPEFHNFLKFNKLLESLGFLVAGFCLFLLVLGSFHAVFSHGFSHSATASHWLLIENLLYKNGHELIDCFCCLTEF